MKTFLKISGAALMALSAHAAYAQQTGSDISITVVTFDFPYIAAGRKLPDRGPVLEQTFEEVWEAVWRTDPARPDASPRRIFAGGKSMGGRMASQVAARAGFAPPPAGLVFFGYPLHSPRRPADRRDQHLGTIARPLLFLHGTRDPFGSPAEMQTLVAGLPHATLALIEGGDHSLALSRRQDPAGASLDRAIAIAAEWMLRGAAVSPPRTI